VKPKYEDILDAYDKATTELMKRRGGRTNTPTKEFGYGGACGAKDYAYLDALTVWVRAEATDPGSGDRPYWFMLYFIPDPLLPKPEWTPAEMKILMRAVRHFGCELCVIDFIPRCLKARRGCLRKRKCGGQVCR
jgi:hypothetical protein